MKNTPFTDGECQWIDGDIKAGTATFCGEAIHPNVFHPYCSLHLERSRRKSTSHAELVEMINTPVQHDTRPKHAKGNEAAARKRRGTRPVKNAYDFMAHAGGGE